MPSPLKAFVEALETSLVVAHALANAFVVLAVAGLWLLPAGAVSIFVWRRLRSRLQAFGRWLT